MTEQLNLYEIACAAHRFPDRSVFGDAVWEEMDYEYPFPHPDPDSLIKIRDDWYKKLCILRCGRGTPWYPSDDQIASFTKYLVENQRNDMREFRFSPGSWVIPRDPAMPSDARVDFAYFPTYIAIAWLCLVKEEHPAAVRHVQGLERALQKGFRFASGRHLYGHGHDASQELLKAVRVLSLGKAFSLIREWPELSPRFSQVVEQVESDLVDKIPSQHGFSTSDAAKQQHALALIKGSDSNDALVCPEIWSDWHKIERDYWLGQIAERAAEAAGHMAATAVKEELNARRQEFTELFESMKPTFAVFQSRRTVVSESVPLESELDITSAVRNAIAEQGIPAWVPPMSDTEVLRTIGEAIAVRMSEPATDLLRQGGLTSAGEAEVSLITSEVGENGQCKFYVKVTG